MRFFEYKLRQAFDAWVEMGQPDHVMLEAIEDREFEVEELLETIHYNRDLEIVPDEVAEELRLAPSTTYMNAALIALTARGKAD